MNKKLLISIINQIMVRSKNKIEINEKNKRFNKIKNLMNILEIIILLFYFNNKIIIYIIHTIIIS